MSPEPSIRHRLQQVVQLQGDMLRSLAEADLDRLLELDHRCREIFSGISGADLSEQEATLATESMRSFMSFHAELHRACVEQRDQAAAELTNFRKARSGASKYQETKDQGV